MNKRKYGYVRVSSREQHEDRQLEALKKFKVRKNNIFVDKQSGINFDRPNYKILIDKLKKDDLLIIKSIDRLGRNYEEILEQWKLITKTIGADIIILDMPLLDTTKSKDLLGTFISDIVLQLLSFVSENERNNIKQRQKEGIEAAKKKGVKFGRPDKDYPNIYEEIINNYKIGKINRNDAINKLNISRSTFYKLLKQFNV